MKLTNGQKLNHLRHEIEMIGRELGIYIDYSGYVGGYDMGEMLSNIKARIAAIRQEAAMYRFAKEQARKQL